MWVRSQDRMTLINGDLFGIEKKPPTRSKKEYWVLWGGKGTCSDVVLGTFRQKSSALAVLDGIATDTSLIHQVGPDPDPESEG